MKAVAKNASSTRRGPVRDASGCSADCGVARFLSFYEYFPLLPSMATGHGISRPAVRRAGYVGGIAASLTRHRSEGDGPKRRLLYALDPLSPTGITLVRESPLDP